LTIWMTNCRAKFHRAILRLALRYEYSLAASLDLAFAQENWGVSHPAGFGRLAGFGSC
jgi:hypothetical protein